jgi:hypothetical protein
MIVTMRPPDSVWEDTIDLRQPAVGVGEIRTVLDTVAADLRHLWLSAIERGDFAEITRLVEASHAVHRAALALTADGVITAGAGIPQRIPPYREGGVR